MRVLPFAVALLLPMSARAASNFGSLTMKLEHNASHTLLVPGSLEYWQSFNAASCACHNIVDVEMQLVNAPAGDLGTQEVQIWVGSNCATFDVSRDDRCVKIQSYMIQEFHNVTSPVRLSIDVSTIVAPKGGGACPASIGNNNIWALVNEGNDATYDHIWPDTPFVVSYDTQPPTVPVQVVGAPVENGVEVSWMAPSTGVNNIRHYRILCASSIDGLPLLNQPTAAAEYQREEDVCHGIPGSNYEDAGPTTADAAPPDVGLPDAGAPDAGVDAAGVADAGESSPMFAKFDALDPAYICSGLIGNTARSYRVDLSNTKNVKPFSPGEMIMTKVVAISTYYNPAGVNATVSALPAPVRDAWEVYHDDGGTADGGYCFVATAVYGDYDHPYVKVLRRFRDETLARSDAGRSFIAWYYAHSPPWADYLRRHPFVRGLAAVGLFPVVALAWLWNGAGPIGLLMLVAFVVFLRRRRRRLALATAAIVALLAGLQPASAQVMLEEDAADEPVGRPLSFWGFEIKIGPYYPDIDGESGLTGKPYATTFGTGKSVLPQMELDRYFFHPHGELGLGVSAGYMWNSAKAFQQDATGHATMMRASDDTGFKMLPVALLVVYRMTELADRTVVPLVPYAKLGLSYYIWELSKGDGSPSETATGQKGRGATFGWQGSLGVAIRAEQLDPEAAASLETDMGVEHAGFFFDVTYANVSGLFQSNKLHLGDFTWAAGVNFEF